MKPFAVVAFSLQEILLSRKSVDSFCLNPFVNKSLLIFFQALIFKKLFCWM